VELVLDFHTAESSSAIASGRDAKA
jgi:hypothetical protein